MYAGARPILGLFVLLLLSSACTSVEPPSVESSPQLYWGAYIDYGGGNAVWGDPKDPQNGVTVFESHAGKSASILHFGLPWEESGGDRISFPTSVVESIRSHGSIPLIDWGSWQLGGNMEQPRFQDEAILSGGFDSFIARWALDAKEWGHPFFLRFDHEMNAWWFPWGEGQYSEGGPTVNGNRPGDYVKLWRHVHDIFTRVGATNVTWVWCPITATTSSRYAPPERLYPGDGYVDWTCLDVYNDPSLGWKSFSELMTGEGSSRISDSYDILTSLSPRKPLMLGEFASGEDASGNHQRKATWIVDTLSQIPSRFKAIKAVVWFNWNENESKSYLIESSREAQTAFADGIRSRLYAANDFAHISTSPIRPLPAQRESEKGP